MKPSELMYDKGYDDYPAECPNCGLIIVVHHDWSHNQEETISYYKCEKCSCKNWWYC